METKKNNRANQSINMRKFRKYFFDTFNNDDSGFDTEKKHTHNDEDELPHI